MRKHGLALAALLTLLTPFVLHAPYRAGATRSGAAPSASAACASAAELACFSDGVACVHSAECCSGGCENGTCGARSKLRRRLARR